MSSFLVWITVITPIYEATISHGLLQSGYIVGSGFDNYPIAWHNVLAYHITHNKSREQVSQDVLDILQSNKMFYHSLIVVDASNGIASTTMPTNIKELRTNQKQASNKADIDSEMQRINQLIAAGGKTKGI